MQQVRFAETGRPVDEQRVVRTGRALGDAQRGRVGETVRRADDELVERVARVELRGGPRAVGARGFGGSRPHPFVVDLGRRDRRQHERLVGAGRGRDDHFDRVGHAGECLDRVGDQAEVARSDALARDRAGHAEKERLVGAVECMHALEPRVPRGFRELRAHRGRHFGPQVICSWSAHVDSPIFQQAPMSTGMSTHVEKPDRRCGPSSSAFALRPAGPWITGK
jgi:hypothetical protein